MRLLDTVRRRPASPTRSTLADYLEQVSFGFQGNTYFPQFTYSRQKTETPEASFEGMVKGAYKSDGVVFAVSAARELLLSETRFKFRNLSTKAMFGGPQLLPLEMPWTNGTTGDLLRRMEQDATLCGNAYIVRHFGQLKRLNPGRVAILLRSETSPEEPEFGYDAQVAGYLYTPKPGADATFFEASEVAHWSPIPDPGAQFRGMSWLAPIVREITSDQAATRHKQAFFENAATPNLVIKLPETVANEEQYRAIRKAMEESHKGAANAYETLYLAGGADVSVVGTSAIDFKQIQGAYETRICMAARVPAAIAGASEGLQGSSLNSGNFGQARRQFADGWYHPTIKDVCSVLSKFVQVPTGSELWYDTSDIPFLREDQLDAANIMATQLQAARQGIDGGWDPDAVVEAVSSFDITKLTGQHSGMLSVQLQPPGVQETKPAPEPKRDAPINVYANTTFDRESITVDARTDIQDGAVRVESPTTISEGAIHLDQSHTEHPATIEVPAPIVNVEAPVIPEPAPRSKVVREVIRDEHGAIVRVEERDAD